MSPEQMEIAELLYKISQRAAVLMHQERLSKSALYWCACIGNAPGEPVCRCAMKWVYQVGSCWYQIQHDGTAKYLCPVGFRIVYT